MKLLAVAGLVAVLVCPSQARNTGAIPANTKIYVDAASGFDTYLAAEMQRRHVPLTITTTKAGADYELEAVSGASRIPGPDWWNLWTRGYGEAGIRVVDIRTNAVVFTSGFDRKQVPPHLAERGQSLRGEASIRGEARGKWFPIERTSDPRFLTRQLPCIPGREVAFFSTPQNSSSSN